MSSKQSVSDTAYYCCGARFQDAKSNDPVCGDTYAQVFMDDYGLEIFSKFDNKKLKNGKIANATRHRIIDDLIKNIVEKNPETVFILIGSGFDTRAYRIKGGKWIEIDDPELISLKNKQLSKSQCKNVIQRIPYDYKTESLVEKFQSINKEDPVTFVIEGVLFYLEENEINTLLNQLTANFPNHKLICDLQQYEFFKKYNKILSKIMDTLGSPFKIFSNEPEKNFIDCGYKELEKISILEKVIKLGKIKIPKILLKTIFRKTIHGYSVFVFDYRGNNKK
ncbi:MAG: class I SAM-dependent methyltransferase [Deltaproteobacteria bacterium]|nr:class I SAM-dependent methyltransferase [Deltaproteobacteria bacterium]